MLLAPPFRRLLPWPASASFMQLLLLSPSFLPSCCSVNLFGLANLRACNNGPNVYGTKLAAALKSICPDFAPEVAGSAGR